MTLIERDREYFYRKENIAKKWLVITDGGGDVNPNRERVQIAYALFMWILQLDVIMLCRYEANGSAKNPGERPHAVVNRELSGVTLPREDLLVAQQKLVDLLSNAKYSEKRLIVEGVEGESNFFPAQWYSLFRGKKQNLIAQIGDTKFDVPARLKSLLEILKLPACKTLPTINELRGYIKTHSNGGQYFWTIKSCNQEVCKFCSKSSFVYPTSTLFPPLPIPSKINRGHYLSLAELLIIDKGPWNGTDYYVPIIIDQKILQGLSTRRSYSRGA